MKNLQRWAALAALCCALPAAAQDDGGKASKQPDAEQLAAKLVDGMSRGLDLTDAQKKKIVPILKQEIPEKLALQNKLRKLERDTDEKIRAVLDDDQKDKFDRMRVMKQMRQRGMAMRMRQGLIHGPTMRGGPSDMGPTPQPPGGPSMGPGQAGPDRAGPQDNGGGSDDGDQDDGGN